MGKSYLPLCVILGYETRRWRFSGLDITVNDESVC
jgi:hypothetical protein